MPFSHTPSSPSSSSPSSSSSAGRVGPAEPVEPVFATDPSPSSSSRSNPDSSKNTKAKLLPNKGDPAMFVPTVRPANLTQAVPGSLIANGFPFAEPIQSHRHVYALCNPSSSESSSRGSGACAARFEDDLWSCANVKCSQQINSAIDRSSNFRLPTAAAAAAAAASAMQEGAALHQCMRAHCAPQYIAVYSLACVDLEHPALLRANVRLESMPPAGWWDQQAIASFQEYSARATLRAAGHAIPPPPDNSSMRIGICTLSQPLGSNCNASALTCTGEVKDPSSLPLPPEPKYWPSLGTVLVPKLGPSMPDAFDLSVPQNYYLPTVTCNASSNTLTAIISTRGGTCASSSQCMFGLCVDNKCPLDTAKSKLTASDLDTFNARRDQSSTPSSMPVSTVPSSSSSSSGPPEPVIFMLPVVALVAVMVWVSVKRHTKARKHDMLARNLRGLGQMTATGRPGLLGGGSGVVFAPTSTARPALDAWGPRAASDRASESFHAGCSSLERGHAMLDPIDHETLPRYSTFAHRMSMMFVSAVMTTLHRRGSVVSAGGGVDEEEVALDLANAPPVPPLPEAAAQAAANAIMPPPPSYDVHREHSVVDVSVAGSVRSSRPSLDTLGGAGASAGEAAGSRPGSLLRVSLSRQHSVRGLAEQAAGVRAEEVRTALLTPVADEGGDDDEMGAPSRH